jgi:hypothetical protein
VGLFVRTFLQKVVGLFEEILGVLPVGHASLLCLAAVRHHDGCENASFYSYVETYTCGVAELTETLPPGTWWLWIGPPVFEGILCGTEYMCELEGYNPVTSVGSTSWSSVKALYR